MKVWAHWQGGTNYAHGYLSDDVETFASITAAVDAFTARRDNDGGDTPNVDNTATMALYFYNPVGEHDPYPDRMVEVGPRGGVNVNPV